MKKLGVFFAFLIAFAACSKKDGDNDLQKRASNVIEGKNGLKYYTGLVKETASEKEKRTYLRFNEEVCENLPEEFDLRPLGVVSPVRDQGQCGSCWAHSMTEALESALKLVGITVKLSVQELVSNDKGNWGCSGGLMQPSKAYQVLHGQGLDKDFPYRAADLPAKSIPVAGKALKWEFIGESDRIATVAQVKCALYKKKSTPWVTVGADNAWGNPPSSESTPYNRCSNAETNHAVTIAGWNKLGWIMMNSWGTPWGAKGFMTIPFGRSGNMGVCNNFGDEVAFVSVEQPAPTPTPPGPSPTPTPPGPTPIPGPCTEAPKVKQAAEVQVFPDVEVMLGVKAEANTTYTWTSDGAIVGSESMLYIKPIKDGLYKLSAKNACAVAESQVRVRLVQSK